MQIVESAHVDLISPFPTQEVRRIVNWLHCYKSVMWADGLPTTNEDMEKYILHNLGQFPSWGVIDKFNALNYKHEAPLIGIVWVEPGSTPANIYIHFTSTRKAWGSGLMDEATIKVMQYIFGQVQELKRISACVINSNTPAKAYLKRIGFKQDGLFKDFVTQNGEPKSMAHFGFLRSYPWGVSEVPQPQSQTISTKPLEATALVP